MFLKFMKIEKKERGISYRHLKSLNKIVIINSKDRVQIHVLYEMKLYLNLFLTVVFFLNFSIYFENSLWSPIQLLISFCISLQYPTSFSLNKFLYKWDKAVSITIHINYINCLFIFIYSFI